MSGYVTQEMEQWAADRETSELVALAIHAVEPNDPDGFWEDPGVNGIDVVKKQMIKILDSTPELSDPDNEYCWGIEIVSL